MYCLIKRQSLCCFIIQYSNGMDILETPFIYMVMCITVETNRKN